MARIIDSLLSVSRPRFSYHVSPRFSLLTALLFTLCACCLSQTLAIRSVTVIDGTGAAARSKMTVVIDRDRIVFIGTSKQAHIPKDALVVEGAGKFLIPGLWDMHVHGATDHRAQWSHLLFLANGVVGVRDMAGPPDAHAWRAAQASNQDPSPTIYLASPIVDGPNPYWPDSIVAANEAQAHDVVAQQHERGADFIKVYDGLSRSAYFAIAEEAKRRGIPFEGHVPESISAEEASDAGQRSIEHLTRVALSCTKEEATIDAELKKQEGLFRATGATMEQKIESGRNIMQLDSRVVQTYDNDTAQALFARFVLNTTWQCPTLTLLKAKFDDPLPADDPRWKYLPKADQARFEAGYYKSFPPGPRAAMIQLTKLEFEESMKIVGKMQSAGVPILAGTDAMNPKCFPGFSLHDELALLVDAGLTPLAALQTATRNAAQFMGQLDRRGTIETGKIADLILLDKDPLADIHNTRAIQAVILRGKLYARTALDAMLVRAQTLARSAPDVMAEK